MILYVHDAWHEEEGGELRLFVGPAASEGCCGFVDVQPLESRLVLFWSDDRAPHAVLPTHRERFAVSCWYHMVPTNESSPDSRCDPPAGAEITINAIEALTRQLHPPGGLNDITNGA